MAGGIVTLLAQAPPTQALLAQAPLAQAPLPHAVPQDDAQVLQVLQQSLPRRRRPRAWVSSTSAVSPTRDRANSTSTRIRKSSIKRMCGAGHPGRYFFHAIPRDGVSLGNERARTSPIERFIRYSRELKTWLSAN